MGLRAAGRSPLELKGGPEFSVLNDSALLSKGQTRKSEKDLQWIEIKTAISKDEGFVLLLKSRGIYVELHKSAFVL